MPETIRDQWMKLCDQAQQEQNSAKLIELVTQINELMDEEERAKKQRQAGPTTVAPHCS